MTTSPRWRSVLASAATTAALVAVPLVGAGTAQAQDHPVTGPHPTKTAYPPKQPKPHKPHKPHYDNEHNEHGHHGDPHLANTGNDATKKLILGGVAASLVAAGAGTMLVARRRRNS